MAFLLFLFSFVSLSPIVPIFHQVERNATVFAKTSHQVRYPSTSNKDELGLTLDQPAQPTSQLHISPSLLLSCPNQLQILFPAASAASNTSDNLKLDAASLPFCCFFSLNPLFYTLYFRHFSLNALSFSYFLSSSAARCPSIDPGSTEHSKRRVAKVGQHAYSQCEISLQGQGADGGFI